jgi:hypothetical protein
MDFLSLFHFCGHLRSQNFRVLNHHFLSKEPHGMSYRDQPEERGDEYKGNCQNEERSDAVKEGVDEKSTPFIPNGEIERRDEYSNEVHHI